MRTDIKITEVLSRVVSVDAVSVQEAIEIVNKMYSDEEIVLDYSDFNGDVIIEQQENSLSLGKTLE